MKPAALRKELLRLATSRLYRCNLPADQAEDLVHDTILIILQKQRNEIIRDEVGYGSRVLFRLIGHARTSGMKKQALHEYSLVAEGLEYDWRRDLVNQLGPRLLPANDWAALSQRLAGHEAPPDGRPLHAWRCAVARGKRKLQVVLSAA